MASCLIGLGSNLGDRRQTLDWACQRLAEAHETKVVAQSRWHQTAPIGGPGDQRPFLNGALCVETSLEPEVLLGLLQEIENERGRRRAERWGPRVLDLDLLLYDQLILSTPRLSVPHPRMAWRRFVLEPAVEVAAGMVHPSTGWTIEELLAHLNTAASYVAVAGPVGVGKTRLAGVLSERISAEPIAEEFDPARLETFYRDPAGHAWAVEIQFLEARARVLAADAPRWSEPNRLWVSDFWFDQSLAYAGVWLPPQLAEAFRERWLEARRRVQPPKLTVLLDAPIETLAERIRQRGRPSEQSLTAAQLEAIRQAILSLAGQRGHGPILWLTHDDTDRVFAEVAAAIEAMR